MDRKREIRDEDFFLTGQEILNKVHEAESVSREEILSSWENVERAVQKKAKPRRLVLRRAISAVAASVAILIATSIGLWMKSDLEGSPSLSLLKQNPIGISGQEVVLFAQNTQMQMTDESSITYSADGNLDLKGQVTRTIVEPKSEESSQSLNQIVVPKGRKVDVTFSDGTKMYVNAGSRVIYPTLFEKDKREIAVEGEVYLEVKKDPSRPFIVKTNGFDIKVLGTRFNVCAYKEDAVASVVLVEGKVEVKTPKEKTVLSPNQYLSISEQGTEIKQVDVFEYICWKENKMLLNNRPVGEVFDRLARHYGRCMLYNDDIKAIPISGTLDLRKEPEEVVSILCRSLYLSYQIDENNRITISKKQKPMDE